MGSDETEKREQSSAIIVKPFGYVEDKPIVRHIGDRELYLGNVLAANPGHHDRAFEYVLSATHDEQPLTTHHRPLIDGSNSDWASFERAVDTARTLFRKNAPTLNHYKAGISRSSAIITTTFTSEKPESFTDSLAFVPEARPPAVSHPALHELVVVYLAYR